MFKSISIPQKGLLPAMAHGRDMLRMSAGRMGRDPGKSSLFTPCVTGKPEPNHRIAALLCCLRQMVQLQARMGFVSKHQKDSVTLDTVFELSLLKEKPFKSNSFLPMPGCFNFQ